ncbi:Aldo keto reductase [Artomyces pyxidatus]|uniref:Aldo keto reductase n=1 Tax=Artomyces pyxidatus TaxID=48021 RepID=A0ACB8T2I1_9AGAM|nr:Aldo keto reductase [Artomyces pyxidatus]
MSIVDDKRRVPYVRLGESGLKVSRIILGCMSYGTPDWMPWVLGEDEGIQHIKAAYDLGIQTFDTANIYSMGLSEVILGKAIKQHNLPRDEIVVMTKNPEDFGYVNQEGLSRKHIFDSVQHSLSRLQLDYIDVLQCHRFDPNTPIEETMHALHDVVQRGWVRYIGMSSCFAWQFSRQQKFTDYAMAHHLTPFISMQNHYNLLYREEEREMMPTLQHFGVASIPWSPLARGLLARSPDAPKTKRGGYDRWHAMYLADSGGSEIINRVEQLAGEKGVTMGQLSLAWILTKDGNGPHLLFHVAVAAPVIGTTSLDNLYDLLGALEVNLSEADIKFLEEPYRPMPIIGHP